MLHCSLKRRAMTGGHAQTISRGPAATITAQSNIGFDALRRLLKCSIFQIMTEEKRSACNRRCEPADPKLMMIELSRYGFETLREDEGLAFCRGGLNDGELPTILSLTPVSEHPDPAILERLEHEYSLRDELGSDWRLDLWLSLIERAGQPCYSRTLVANRSICSWDTPATLPPWRMRPGNRWD
jgi:hypothetical protein